MINDNASRGNDLRTLFLLAAREILAEPDTALDLRKVAERAGKSRTAPYLVFGKTEEGGGLSALRLAVAAEGFRELASELRGAGVSASDPEEGLHRMASAYLGFAHREPRLFRLMFGFAIAREMARGADGPAGHIERDELRRAREAVEQAIVSSIERQAEGYLRSSGRYGSRIVAGALLAMLHGTAMLSIDQQWVVAGFGESEKPEELAEQVLRVLTTTSSASLRAAAEGLTDARIKKMQAYRELGNFAVRETLVPDYLRDFPDALGAAPEQDAAPPLSAASRRDAVPDLGALSASGPPARRRAAEPPPPHSTALRRARAASEAIRGARILWIDDHPDFNEAEARALEALGAEVTVVRGTEPALRLLEEGHFHLILSDIDREGFHNEGIRALPRLREAAPDTPVVFYVEQLRPEVRHPPEAFGITDDPDELVHLVLDVVERRRV